MTSADPPPESARRGRRRDSDINRRVLGAARTLVAQNGVRGASFSSIASCAGSGKPSLYLRWPNYTGILVAVIAEMETVVEPLIEGSVPERLLKALEEDRAFLTDPERIGFISAVLSAADSVPVCARELRTRVLAPRRDRLVSIMREHGGPPVSAERGRRIEAAADHLQAPLLHAIVCRGSTPSYGGLANAVATVVEGVGTRPLGGDERVAP